MADGAAWSFAFRLGRWLFALCLFLLPGWLRRGACTEMVEVFEARQREGRARGGIPGLLSAWAHEILGVCLTAVTSRRRVVWPHAEGDEASRVSPHGRHVLRFVDGLGQDVRFAARAAARSRGTWALALLTCALGAGASTAMFSVVDSVLWRPLPYPEPGRIVTVYPTIPQWRQVPALADRWMRGAWSQPEYIDWRSQQTAFTEVAALGRSVATLTDGGEPVRIEVGNASPSLFPMLGAAPVLGRTFGEGEAGANGGVAMLSHAIWVNRYGGARDVVGRTLRTDAGAYTIIGVLPPTFGLTGLASDVWLPIRGRSDALDREDHNLTVVARLAPDVTLAQAQRETERLLERLSAGHDTRHGAFLVPRLEDETRQVRAPLAILLAAALLLLVVACVNVAALLLGMGLDREQELVVRGAVGAGRGRLVRQLVTESVVLASAGGAAGVALAYGLTDVLVALAPPGIPRLEQIDVSGRALLFASAVTAMVGLGFGLVPALALTGTDVAGRLRGARIAGGRGRLHAALVVAQLALACVLLIGAGLLTRTLIALDRVDPGFDVDGVLAVRVAPSFSTFRSGGRYSADLSDRYYDDVRAALAAVPGVRDVAITTALPFGGDGGNNYVSPSPAVPGADSIAAGRYYVSANYMALVGVRVVEGRGFTDGDDRAGTPPAAIISEAIAHSLWPGESAVGRTLRFYAGRFTVVGVVADIRDRSLQESGARFYVPRRQRPGEGGSFVLRAHDGIDPLSLSADLRRAVWSVDGDVPVPWIGTLRQRVADSLVEQRFRARLMIAFAAFAALFAVLGIYGVTSRSVTARTREIGIRIALGERRSGVVRLVMGQALRLCVAGAAIGIAGGLAAAPLLAAFLYGTSPADPLTVVLVGAALGTLAAAASLPSSLRAARVDPIRALRTE